MVERREIDNEKNGKSYGVGAAIKIREVLSSSGSFCRNKCICKETIQMDQNLDSRAVNPSFISFWIALAWGRLLIWFTVTFVPFSPWKFTLMMKPSWPYTVSYRCIFRCWYCCNYTAFVLYLFQYLKWQHYIKLTELEKNRKLNDLLDALDFNQVVIFVKSVNRAAELNKLLVECNFPSICIHSGMSQEERFIYFRHASTDYVKHLVVCH